MNPNQETQVTIVHDKTRDVIESAVDKMVDFIAPTYGPAGNKVIIDKMLYKMTVDDGVQIARDFELPDPVENAVVRLIREVAIKTNDREGDGTTSSLIMLRGIFHALKKHRGLTGREVELQLKKGLADVKKVIEQSAKKIKTLDELEKVARVSFDDEKISKMIAELYFKLGNDALITVEKGQLMETICETSDGVKIDRGYISQYMITNPERMETELDKPYILLTDYRITEANDIMPIMEKMVKENKRQLVVICENMEHQALATAVINRIKDTFFILAINLPPVEDKKVFLEDLGVLLGAKVFTESKGDKLQDVAIADLGRAGKIISHREETVIVGPKGKKATIQEAIVSLRAAIAIEHNEHQKKSLERRLGLFTNTIAVIKVGAMTDNEQKALKYKVEDAVNAVRSACKTGVVCGSGLGLARIETSSPILNEALKHPARQLRENMGLDPHTEIKAGEAQNMVTGEIGPFMKVGVMDPAKVLLAGVESAVSIASLLLTSHGILVESPKNREK